MHLIIFLPIIMKITYENLLLLFWHNLTLFLFCQIWNVWVHLILLKKIIFPSSTPSSFGLAHRNVYTAFGPYNKAHIIWAILHLTHIIPCPSLALSRRRFFEVIWWSYVIWQTVCHWQYRKTVNKMFFWTDLPQKR